MLELGVLIGFLFTCYVGASIVRSVRGYRPPPPPKSEMFDTIEKRDQ